MEPPVIDVAAYRIEAELDLFRSFMRGKVEVDCTILSDTVVIPLQLSRQLSIVEATDETGARLSMRGDDYSRDGIRLQGEEVFREGSQKTLTLQFEGLLEKEQYAFLDVPISQKAVISKDGAVLLSEGLWFPSYRLATDAATVRARITVPLGFGVVAPGELVSVDTLGVTEAFNWETKDEVTEVPVIVARFFRQSYGEGPIPLTFFLSEDFKGDVAGLGKTISEIIEFFKAEYGDVPVSGLTVAQSGNLGIPSPGSNGLLLLEDQIVKAPKIPEGVLATRLALQWFGFSVRMERPVDAWLADGFATYASLRFLQAKRPDLFESELARHAVEALKYQDQAPVASGLNLERGSPRYQSIVGSKGAWVLYMLGQLIGPDRLTGILKDFYGGFAGKPASIGDFSAAVKTATGEDYGWFFVQWIESVGVPEFRLDYTIFKLKDGTFKIRGQVSQNIDLFRMPMDVLIHTKGEAEEKSLVVDGKNTKFEFATQTVPVRIELDPNGKVLMDSERMRIAVNIAMGDEYREKGEFVSAIQEYERAVSLNPRNSLAHYRLGQTYFEQHSYSNAANSMRDSLNGDLKPDWVETWAHIYLGKVYDILGQRQRARAEYQKAINSKNDFNGAQAEAQKYLDQPFNKPDSVISG